MPRKVKKYLNNNIDDIVNGHIGSYLNNILDRRVEELVYHINYKFHGEMEMLRKQNETILHADATRRRTLFNPELMLINDLMDKG